MEESAASAHVAVLAFPFGSHAGPLLNLVQKIAVSSPDVTFVFFSTARSISSVSSQMQRVKNVIPHTVDDGVSEGFVGTGNPIEAVNFFLKAIPRNYREAMEKAMEESGKRFTCLVTDAFFWFGAEFAIEIDAKWVPLWTAGPHALLAHLLTDTLRDKISFNGGK